MEKVRQYIKKFLSESDEHFYNLNVAPTNIFIDNNLTRNTYCQDSNTNSNTNNNNNNNEVKQKTNIDCNYTSRFFDSSSITSKELFQIYNNKEE